MEPIFNLVDIMSSRRSKSKVSPRRSEKSSPTPEKKMLLTKQNLYRHNGELALMQSLEAQGVENGKCETSRFNCNYVKAPRRNEVHIEYRKCKQRECSVCKPVLKNYRSLCDAVDPILFTRWERKTDGNRTTLAKVNYVVNGLGQVIRNVDRSAEGKVKEGAEVIKSKVRVRLDTLRGQRVIARKDQDGLYYPAVVLKCSDPRHALVRYDGNEEAQILTRNVIPVGGAVARPPLYVGDYVLIRVVYLDTKDECYVPAIIQVEPQRVSASQKFYSVLMYNGQKATTMRKYLVKISKERFELASMYIAEQQNEDREEAQDLLYVSPRASNKRRKTRPDDMRKHQRKRSPLSVSSKASSEEDRVIEEESDEDNYQEKSKDKKQGSSRKIKKDQQTRGSSNSKSRSRLGAKYSGENSGHSSGSSKSRSRSRSDSRSRKNSKPKSRSRSRSRSESSQSSKSSRSRSRSDSSRSSRPRSRDKKTKKSDRENGSSNAKKNQHECTENNGLDNFFDDERSSSPNKNEDLEDKQKTGDKHDEVSESNDNMNETSKELRLEELQQKLLSQQKRQERQKRKLKKKAKQLAQQRKAFKSSLLKEIGDGEPGGDGDVAVLVDGQDFPPVDPSLIELRKQLEHLRPGEEALARWSDDGWYYRGIIRQYHGDYSYDVEDSTGFIERIWREDLVSENDASGTVFELNDKAIALHPDYSFSYAPGLVSSVNDSDLEIVFYDGRSAALPWGEVYHYHPAKEPKKDKAASVTIPQANEEVPEKQIKSVGGSAKYKLDVAYIKACEEKLVGAAVVARDDRTGAYYPCTVKKRSLDKSCSYTVSWADGSDSLQDAIHIFSAYTRSPKLSIGDRVLACVDPVHIKFLPGHLAGPGRDGRLVVKFCNSETRDDIDESLCYWLGQQYHDAAVKYFKTHDPSYY
ncbi:von Willebrand factor A domain-containing protein 3B [Elysia marginata]|uniref:von Willebrand factor A domain-containing protein 3B n=1 Tax=Elysia marginata TaxID=1093978 RepID=A0AAV4EC52_9GAST|nr:von Willebrand factor A domain-containing protein 3B [Elysia marginata]